MLKNHKMLCIMLALVLAATLIGCTAAGEPEATDESTGVTTEVTTEATTEATTEETTEETTEATEETTEATEETTEATEAEGESTGDEDQTGGAENTGNGSNGGTVENTGNGGNGGTVENTGNTGSTTETTAPPSGNTGSTTETTAPPANETEPADTTPAGPTMPSNKPGVCEHNWSDWTVTKGATTMAEGEQIRSCSKCGKSETQTIPKVYINVNELIAAGNSYAASLGFTIDTSLNESNAGYCVPLDYPLQTMADGYSMMATAVASTKADLMRMDYANGWTDSPDVWRGGRCNCNVTYAGESEMGPIYLFWCFYG